MVPVGDHAEACDHQEGVVTVQAEARNRRVVVIGGWADRTGVML